MWWLCLFFMLCTVISVALWRVAICAYDRELQVKISEFFIRLFMVLSIVCVIIMFIDIKIPVNASEESILYQDISNYSETVDNNGRIKELSFTNKDKTYNFQYPKIQNNDTDGEITQIIQVTEQYWKLNSFTSGSDIKFILE